VSALLRIGIVAPLWLPVPPITYGGIERHLHGLVEELVRRGHDVTLFASGDSHTSAKLVAVCPRGVAETMDAGEASFYEPYLNASLAAALAASASFDLLHCHVGCAAIPLAEAARCPVLHSVHTGLTRDDAWVLERHPDVALTALSARQLEPLPAARRAPVRVVPYGFDFTRCGADPGPAEHLAFLGRMAPHKGPDAAIAIAREAGRPIHLAGAPVTAEDRAWFARVVEPEVDGRDVVWLGAVDDAGKDALFRRAAAFVFPISWEEPFGLVMLEALARGVPVLATRRGSVPEVVEPGVTGFVADAPADLAGQVAAAARLDRTAVRAAAARRFSVSSMVDAYEAAYAAARATR
jgi:glycosyltransferase involved in cell wall biosynthesis